MKSNVPWQTRWTAAAAAWLAMTFGPATALAAPENCGDAAGAVIELILAPARSMNVLTSTPLIESIAAGTRTLAATQSGKSPLWLPGPGRLWRPGQADLMSVDPPPPLGLRSEYVGEEFGIARKWGHHPKVVYLNDGDALAYEAVRRDGRLFWIDGTPVDTSRATNNFGIKAMGVYSWQWKNGAYRLFISSDPVEFLCQHSTPVAGGPLVGGGEIMVIDGYVLWVDTKSGHYFPTDEHLRRFVKWLETGGIYLGPHQWGDTLSLLRQGRIADYMNLMRGVSSQSAQNVGRGLQIRGITSMPGLHNLGVRGAIPPPPAEIISPEALGMATLELDAKLGDLLLNDTAPAVAVNGHFLRPPRTVVEVIKQAMQMHELIAASPGNTAQLISGSEELTILKKPLGEGMIGVVYDVVGSNKVVKIPKPHAVAVHSMLQEAGLARDIEVLTESTILETPANEFFHPLGLMAIKAKAMGEPLTQFLLTEGFLRLSSGEHGRLVASRMPPRALAAKLKDPKYSVLTRRVTALLKLRKKHSKLISDLGPDNLFCVFGPKGKLTQCSLVDIGPAGAKTTAMFDKAKTFDDYMSAAESLVNRYLDTGALKLEDIPQQSLPPGFDPP